MNSLILSQQQIPDWAIQVLVFAIIFGGWIVRAIAKAYNSHLEKKQEQEQKQQQYQDRLRSGPTTKGPDLQAGANQPVQRSQRGAAPPAPQRPVRAHPPRRPATGQPQARPVPPPRPVQRPTPSRPPVPPRRPAQKPREAPHLEHVPHVPLPSERPAARPPTPPKPPTPPPAESPVQVDLPSSRRPIVISAEQAEKIRRRFDEQTRQLKSLQAKVSTQRSTIDQLTNDLHAVSEIPSHHISPTAVSLVSQLNPRSLRRVIMLNEVIGQPVSLRNPLQ